MRYGKSPTLNLIAALAVGASLSGCGGLVEYAGGIAGAVVGEKIGDATPVKTKVIVNPKGGNWCGTMNAMGGAIPIQSEDRLTRATTERVVLVNEYGEKHCGWKSAN